MATIACTLLADDDEATNFLNQNLLRCMAGSDTVLLAGPDPARHENAPHEQR